MLGSHAEKTMRLSKIAITAAPMVFVLLWSTGFIGARYGLPYIEPMTFLAVRMIFVVLIMAAIALVSGARWPRGAEIGHSLVAGSLVHGLYLGGVFIAISQGVPAGISALIPGLQPILTSTIANRFMGEKVTRLQWLGLALGLGRRADGAARPAHGGGRLGARLDRQLCLADRHHARHALSEALLRRDRLAHRQHGAIYRRLRSVRAGAFAFETRVIHWTGELIFALVWLVFVLSVAAVALMYWLIRRSAATGFASLFYLVPAVTALLAYLLFGEKLDALSIAGMVVCAVGVVLVNRGARLQPAAANVSRIGRGRELALARASSPPVACEQGVLRHRANSPRCFPAYGRPATRVLPSCSC